MSEWTSRDLTPADLRVLEPDVIGVLALILHGRDRAPDPKPERPRTAPSGWRGRRRPRG